ncbi:hypothetical protein Goshw_004425, partial [Gossypium schwendimanii]|nr:hypothetical protein [Gossypium schwendimanii]
MILDETLYQCEDFDWVPLLEIWRAVGYAPLLVSRQYRLRQFIPAMQGLAQCEFAYKCGNYKKKWWVKQINDNVLSSSQESTRSIEEHLQVIPSELKIVKQGFEKKSAVAAVGWIYGVGGGKVVGAVDVVKELAGVDDGGDDESGFEGDVKGGVEEVMGGFAGETIGVVIGVDFGYGNNPKK